MLWIINPLSDVLRNTLLCQTPQTVRGYLGDSTNPQANGLWLCGKEFWRASKKTDYKHDLHCSGTNWRTWETRPGEWTDRRTSTSPKSFLLDFPLHTTQKWQGRNIFHYDKFIYFQSAYKWAAFCKFATKRQRKKKHLTIETNSTEMCKTSCYSSMLYKKQYHSPFRKYPI